MTKAEREILDELQAMPEQRLYKPSGRRRFTFLHPPSYRSKWVSASTVQSMERQKLLEWENPFYLQARAGL